MSENDGKIHTVQFTWETPWKLSRKISHTKKPIYMGKSRGARCEAFSIFLAWPILLTLKPPLLWNHCLFFRWKSRLYLFQRISKRAKRSKDKIMNYPLQIPNEQGAARASSVSLATKRQKFHFNPLPLYTSSRPKRSQSSRQIRLWGKRTIAGPSEPRVQLPSPSQILAGIRDIHIERSKQFKWNSYFELCWQSRLFLAALKLL